MSGDNTYTMIVEGYETEHDSQALQERLDELFEDSAESATVIPE